MELRRSGRQRVATKRFEPLQVEAPTTKAAWSVLEKKRLLHALNKQGNDDDDYEAISRCIRTRTPSQVKKYLDIIRKKNRLSAASGLEAKAKGQNSLQKWLTVSEKLSAGEGDECSIAKVMSVAALEAKDMHKGDQSLPDPNYFKIYEYLSALLVGNDPPHLSPIDSWVVVDLLEKMESTLANTNTEEQEETLQTRYKYLLKQLRSGKHASDKETDKLMNVLTSSASSPAASKSLVNKKATTSAAASVRLPAAATTVTRATASSSSTTSAAVCSTLSPTQTQGDGAAASTQGTATISGNTASPVSVDRINMAATVASLPSLPDAAVCQITTAGVAAQVDTLPKASMNTTDVIGTAATTTSVSTSTLPRTTGNDDNDNISTIVVTDSPGRTSGESETRNTAPSSTVPAPPPGLGSLNPFGIPIRLLNCYKK